MLMAFGKIYQHNWALISELMTAEHMPKTAWECYERYTALDTPEQRAKPRVARVDAKDRLNKHQKIISFILKRIRTREPRPTPNGGPPRKINLVAHETHQQAQTDAGVDLNSRPLTPLELSQVKARHDQEVRAQAETHRAQQFGQRGAAVGGLPARPGFVQIPVQQVPGYRPVGRPGMALQAGGAALQQAVRVPGLAQGTTAALQRLPAGITPETLKQVMLARALQQQQQQQQQQQAVAAAVARAQPGTAAGFPLPLQVQCEFADVSLACPSKPYCMRSSFKRRYRSPIFGRRNSSRTNGHCRKPDAASASVATPTASAQPVAGTSTTG